MKKTTIIVICVVYLLSILAVQFFGIPYSFPESGEYIESIQIESVSLSNRGVGFDNTVTEKTNSKGVRIFEFNFIPAEDGNEYTTDADSIAQNPNRIKITYKVLPEGVSQGGIKIYLSDENGVVLLDKTEEFAYELVFLKKGKVPKITIREDKGRVDENLTVSIRVASK